MTGNRPDVMVVEVSETCAPSQMSNADLFEQLGLMMLQLTHCGNICAVLCGSEKECESEDRAGSEERRLGLARSRCEGREPPQSSAGTRRCLGSNSSSFNRMMLLLPPSRNDNSTDNSRISGRAPRRCQSECSYLSATIRSSPYVHPITTYKLHQRKECRPATSTSRSRRLRAVTINRRSQSSCHEANYWRIRCPIRA